MFKQVDVAPIMTFDGLARPVPCSIIYKSDAITMAGKPFHIIIFTKIVNGVTVLGGTSFWSPTELKQNILNVGQSIALKNQFKDAVQAQLNAGGVTPQTVVPTTVDGTTPNEVLVTTTGEVTPVEVTATPADDSQVVLDEIANIPV